MLTKQGQYNQAVDLMPWFNKSCLKWMGHHNAEEDDEDESDDAQDNMLEWTGGGGDEIVQTKSEIVKWKLYRDEDSSNQGIDDSEIDGDEMHFEEEEDDAWILQMQPLHDEGDRNGRNIPSQGKRGRSNRDIETYILKTMPPPTSLDPWLNAAYELHVAIVRMSFLLQKQGKTYADLNLFKRNNMTEDEKETFENTVLSFMVQTANQMEQLRQQISSEETDMYRPFRWCSKSSTTTDLIEHKHGIVAILNYGLRHSVALPMEHLQRLRRRPALAMRKDLLQCNYENLSNEEDEMDDFDDDTFFQTETAVGGASKKKANAVKSFSFKYMTSQKTVDNALDSFSNGWTQEELREEEVFSSAYREPLGQHASEILAKRREARRQAERFEPNVAKVTRITLQSTAQEEKVPYDNAANADDPSMSPPIDLSHLRAPQQPQQPVAQRLTVDEQEESHRLQQEHMLLTEHLRNNDLEDVTKMETTMVHITQLLNQFSGLISEQHESVQKVHEDTKTSQKYVEQGQDQLVDATERQKKSAHRMAKVIFAMAILMLFFNHIFP